jgi:DNA-binding NtrC family response regulator
MSSGGVTTISDASSSNVGAPSAPMSIAWRFPHRAVATVALTWDGPEEIVLGREDACAVQLTGHDVSRRHAVLRRTDGGAATIADLDSRNGVRVNGRRVASAVLREHDVLRIGGWIGVVTAAPGNLVELAPGFWGGGAMAAALAPVRQVAGSDLPVIVEGETGTGKELVARALHRWSGRPGAFIAVNCAALPEALAEGELFGYRRGAFTGADRASPGFFRSADKGTLLLDEVSDLPLPLQAKLLRVLEQREVSPLGEPRPVPIDVRIVVAGQPSLMGAVREGRFRGDLLARLEGLTVELPPLRHRREDVLPLFARLLEAGSAGRAPAFDSEVAERLCVYDWPFNVRELVLMTRRLLAVRGPSGSLTVRELPERMRDGAQSPEATPPTPAARRGATGTAGRPERRPTPPASPSVPGEPVQLPALVAALRAARGNVARAAAMLGISRQRAYRLMDEQGVEVETFRGDPERGE